jgi:hypothetical protein
MKQLLIIIFAISFYTDIEAQNKYDYIWHMGYSYLRSPPPEYAPLYGFQFNFNGGKVRIDTMKRNYSLFDDIFATN